MTVDDRDLVPWVFFLSEVRANDRKLRLRVLDSGRNILATTFSAYVEKKALVISMKGYSFNIVSGRINLKILTITSAFDVRRTVSLPVPLH